MMNEQHIETHAAHSHHIADLLHAHSVGSGVHLDLDHVKHNGVVVPDEVLRQLKMLLGENLHMLSSHEIDKAAMNFAANGKVIRDEDGLHLHDMMHEHWGENDNDSKWKVKAPEVTESLAEALEENDEKKLKQQKVAEHFHGTNKVDNTGFALAI